MENMKKTFWSAMSMMEKVIKVIEKIPVAQPASGSSSDGAHPVVEGSCGILNSHDTGPSQIGNHPSIGNPTLSKGRV